MEVELKLGNTMILLFDIFVGDTREGETTAEEKEGASGGEQVRGEGSSAGRGRRGGYRRRYGRRGRGGRRGGETSASESHGEGENDVSQQ